MANNLIKTVKFEITPTGTKEEKNKTWKRVQELQNNVFRIANRAVSMAGMIDAAVKTTITNTPEAREYISKLNQDIKQAYKDKDKKLIKSLKEERSIFIQPFYEDIKNQFFWSKKNGEKAKKIDTIIYHTIRTEFSEVPGDMTGSIVTDALNLYKQEKGKTNKGEASIRNYRNSLPIPLRGRDIKNISVDGFYTIEGMQFAFVLGFGKRNKSDAINKKKTIERVVESEYKLKGSKLRIEKNKGSRKMFLYASIQQPQNKEIVLDKNMICGVDLGITFPAYIAVPDTYYKRGLGSADDLFAWRMQFKSRKRRIQKSSTRAKGGRGRKRKLQNVDALRDKERRYVKTYNHNISREIINNCLKWGCGTIHIEDLTGYKDNALNTEAGKRVLSNWSYHELQQMIEYKAKEYGIIVKYIDPAYTSQTCNCCEQDGERVDQKTFYCKNYDCEIGKEGKPLNADYNAALNIAKSRNFSKKSKDISEEIAIFT